VKRVLLDTNVYIDWLNTGQHEDVVLGPGFVRHMSSVVLMELEVGASTLAARRAVRQLARAFERTQRLVAPSLNAWGHSSGVLRGLRSQGREIRRASLVHDVMIAPTARDVGATLLTGDTSDYSAIRRHLEFSLAAV
jgi:predicted nucleic acid-binding protein